METDWWLELDQSYTSRITERKGLFAKHGKLVLNYLPGSELGCKEIMESALQFYCARYPDYFHLSRSPSKGYIFHNGILKSETVIRDVHPLRVLLDNVPEDFAVMLRNPEDGCYYFRAGVICSSLGWNVDTKLGMQLKQIHSPIPDYKEKMEFSMDRLVAHCAIFLPRTILSYASSVVCDLTSCFFIFSFLSDFSPSSHRWHQPSFSHQLIGFFSLSATFPRSPHTVRYSVVPGVWKSTRLSSCPQVTHTRPIASANPPPSSSPGFIYAWIGRPCAACPSPAPSFSTSKRSSPPFRNSATSPTCPRCAPRS